VARSNNDAGTEAEAPDETPVLGKGKATPSRAEREAANRRPLVPTDRKAAAKENRAKVAADRDRARVGMANGEEKYLSVRDKGPQKRFVRDWMDARWSIGEAVLPLAVVVLVSTVFPPVVAQAILYGVWALFAIAIIDFVIVGQRLTKKLEAKYGTKTERIRFYAAMRGIYPRPMRMPKPQVKRGDYPEL
jgi:hypothetical protein